MSPEAPEERRETLVTCGMSISSNKERRHLCWFDERSSTQGRFSPGRTRHLHQRKSACGSQIVCSRRGRSERSQPGAIFQVGFRQSLCEETLPEESRIVVHPGSARRLRVVVTAAAAARSQPLRAEWASEGGVNLIVVRRLGHLDDLASCAST